MSKSNKGGRKITIDYARVFKLHKEGLSQSIISLRLGISRVSIRKILKKGINETKSYT